MNKVIIAKANTPELPKSILNSMHQFRHAVFVEKLQWDVKSTNGLEIDEYDSMDPVYIVSSPGSHKVNGCWRLLPTTGSYMLKDTFPELLGGEPAPKSPRIWELSRFAADSGRIEQAGVCDVTISLLQTIVEYGYKNNIDEYVTVMSVSMERLLKSIRLPFTRLGNGKAVRLGRILSIAARFQVNMDSYNAIMALNSSLEKAA